MITPLTRLRFSSLSICVNSRRPAFAAVRVSQNHFVTVRPLRVANAWIADFCSGRDAPWPCFFVDTRMYPKYSLLM